MGVWNNQPRQDNERNGDFQDVLFTELVAGATVNWMQQRMNTQRLFF